MSESKYVPQSKDKEEKEETKKEESKTEEIGENEHANAANKYGSVQVLYKQVFPNSGPPPPRPPRNAYIA